MMVASCHLIKLEALCKRDDMSPAELVSTLHCRVQALKAHMYEASAGHICTLCKTVRRSHQPYSCCIAVTESLNMPCEFDQSNRGTLCALSIPST